MSLNYGTIEIGVNTTESGYKNAFVACDYIFIDKNKYEVGIYLQIDGFDCFYTMFRGNLECQYSKIEDWFKQTLRAEVNKGNLRKLFRAYVDEYNSVPYRYEIYNMPVLFNVNGYVHKTVAINWQEMNKIFKDCSDKGVTELTIYTSLNFTKYSSNHEIKVRISGETGLVRKVIGLLSEPDKTTNNCHLTIYEKKSTIIFLFNINGRQSEVKIELSDYDLDDGNFFITIEKELCDLIIEHAVMFNIQDNRLSTNMMKYGLSVNDRDSYREARNKMFKVATRPENLNEYDLDMMKNMYCDD